MCNSELQTNRRVSVAIYLRTIINFPLLLYSECRLATTLKEQNPGKSVCNTRLLGEYSGLFCVSVALSFRHLYAGPKFTSSLEI